VQFLKEAIAAVQEYYINRRWDREDPFREWGYTSETIYESAKFLLRPGSIFLLLQENVKKCTV
jgi:hypothetical protein